MLDLARVGTEEEDEPGQATDRAYRASRGSLASLDVADQVLALVSEITPDMALKYSKHYIGLAHDGIADNFAVIRPRREHAITDFRIPRSDEVT